MPRKRAERGSIARLDRNRYRIRFWGDKGDGKGYRRLSANFTGTLTEARRERDRLILQYSTTNRKNYAVRDVFETLYWPDCQSRLAHNTLKQYRSTWNGRVGPLFGNRLLSDLKPLDIQNAVDSMTKNSALKTVNMLSGIYKIANRYELTDRNPLAAGIRIPEEASRMDDGVYTLGELVRLADGLNGSPVEGLFLLSAFGSCRPAEALAVDPRSVRLVTADNGMVCAAAPIEQEMIHGVGVVDRVKTRNSDRWVVVPGKWGLRLFEVAQNRVSDGHTWFFESRRGNPVSPNRLGQTWGRETKRLGYETHPFRNLRNSWRTAWRYEVGIPVDVLEKLMGHVGDGVSERHYVRPDLMTLVNAVADAWSRFDSVS